MRTTTPSYSVQPEGSLPHFHPSMAYQLWHASLPSERVCTDNLMPSSSYHVKPRQVSLHC